MNSGEDSSDNDIGNIPKGVLKRGGWTDTNNLELEHKREKIREGDDKKQSAVAVDLNQFRNEEVGKGYQAKGVVRQRGSTNETSRVVDMSGSSFSKKGDDSSKKMKRSHEDDEDAGGKKQDPLQSYLQCQGMRDFVKEADKILQQR
mgnify:CR=1 FL=1